MWKPVRLGQVSLPEGELLADKKACRRFGPCGVGEKALYLNSFYFDRRFYVPYSSVSRVYKRVAMSKGGFSGKGMFATIPYLVVEYDGGQEKQCIFKREEDVDLLLDAVKERCPGLPLLSAAAEERLKKKEAERAAKVKSDLPEEVKQEIALLEKADSYLQKRPELSVHLSRAARKKRSFQLAGSGYYKAAAAMLLLGVLALAYSVFLLHQKVGFAASIASFGVTVIFLFSGMRMIPAKETNRKRIEQETASAAQEMEAYLSLYPGGSSAFPLPASYAHPAVLKRMLEALEEGRAADSREALQVVKEDLKKLNSSVSVDAEEYEEIVAIKPLFLNAGYQ